MTLLLLLLYTVLPAALTCLVWRAKCYYNIIDWHGYQHDVRCRRTHCDQSDDCPVAVDIRASDPAFRVKFGIKVAVLALGAVVMGELWTQLAIC